MYTIRLLPIGGFVRMAGEDPEMVEIKTWLSNWTCCLIRMKK